VVAAEDSVDLNVAVEVNTTKPGGYSDDKVCIWSPRTPAR
jgi:hypothetical protein